ncbi:uncharacterized protein LOC105420593 [Amborella trichopoda]|uniref:uncharacterized protein LOC105420593 n=1 Tax=Amborella trichopoda TaxID=13333 RepID=UPI0005D30AC2|nr:uncharacterized protein LOC105420593 [Amborella trichopoda]|eukprot:XP_011623084.1 uncharacterized protein LOC105420593 [Amborella trichopoda]
MSMQNKSPAKAQSRRRLRRWNQTTISHSEQMPPPPFDPETTTGCKSSLSSLLLSTFMNTSTTVSNNIRAKNPSPNSSSSSSSFRGLGCSSAPDVYNPTSAHGLVRASADWQSKKAKRSAKKPHPRRKQSTQVVDSDVWCPPCISLSTDATSIDPVFSRGRVLVSDNGGHKGVHGGNRGLRSLVAEQNAVSERKYRERPCVPRRIDISEPSSDLNSPSPYEMQHPMPDVIPVRNYRHLRGSQRSSGAFAEIVMFQTNLLLGMESFDRHQEWRLDVDNMSYEDLLELGEKIGYVNTGLKEEEIVHCLRKMKHSNILNTSLSQFLCEGENKCSICQEEYEEDDDLGKLDCGHDYHLQCIKQWLLRKNSCPICKIGVVQS